MTAIPVIWLREVRAFRGAFSCGVPVAAFLAASGWTFAMMLRRNEGSVLQVQSIWGLSIAPWLPILSAVLTMRLFAEERATGMIDLLMAAPLRERDLVIGKFLSAMTVMGGALAVSVVVPMLILPALSVPVQGTVRVPAFAATLLILFLQASAWCGGNDDLRAVPQSGCRGGEFAGVVQRNADRGLCGHSGMDPVGARGSGVDAAAGACV